MQPETPMTLDQILDELRNARGKDLPWTRVAELVERALKHPEFRKQFPSMAESKRALATMAGYTAGVLQRMLVTKEFLDARAKELAGKGLRVLDPFSGGGGVIAPDTLPFSKVEIAKRAYDIAPEKGLELLKQIATSDVSSRELREQYTVVYTNPPYHGAGRTSHKHFAEWERRACALVERDLPGLVGSKSAGLYYKRYKFKYIDVDAVSVDVQNHGVTRVDGFEFLKGRALQQPSLFSSFLAQVALKASFFRNFWLVISDDEKCERSLLEALEQLDLMSVGVIRVEDNGATELVRLPKQPPSPDRQDEVKRQVLQQGLPT